MATRLEMVEDDSVVGTTVKAKPPEEPGLFRVSPYLSASSMVCAVRFQDPQALKVGFSALLDAGLLTFFVANQ